MARSYRTEGVILKRINIGEADRILTIFTKHYGKIRVIAKGVRKLTSRKGGNVELFNQIILFVHRGRNLDILSEVEILNSFKAWRKNLVKVGTAYYFCELIDKLTADGQANQAVYKLLVDSLGQIDEEGLSKLVRGFEEQLLDELGFGVPAKLRAAPGSLKTYIEQITEREITSPKILKNL